MFATEPMLLFGVAHLLCIPLFFLKLIIASFLICLVYLCFFKTPYYRDYKHYRKYVRNVMNLHTQHWAP